MPQAFLQWLDERGSPRAALPIGEGDLELGRELVAKLGGAPDASISRRHARVFARGGEHAVEDLGSRNGTLVNGARITSPTTLRPGDVVEVGEQRFRFGSDTIIEEQSAPRLFEGATLAATRAGAPERLRLVYDLLRVAGGHATPAVIAQHLASVVERTLRPRAVLVWLTGADEAAAGDAKHSPFAASLVKERVIAGAQVLRVPGGASPAVALAVPLASDPEPLGALVVAADDARPFSEDDVHFMLAAATLGGVALRRKTQLAALALGAGEDELVGESLALARAKKAADMVAPYDDLSVLLIGETGTGKELFARRVHRVSGRGGPFVAVNVAALPAELLESELFGHVKGAFTGATAARTGYVEYAAGGTLFLDEIGEMPALLQAKLLRVLQDKKIQRVGDPRPIDVDIRLVAATNADLKAKIADGSFREDLYYRVAGKEVVIPPLREREGDVASLARAFVKKSLGRTPHRVAAVSDAALRLLALYPWPGNVRQLEGTMRLAVIHATADGRGTILPEHIDERVRGSSVAGATEPSAAPESLADELAQAERRIVVKAMRTALGNKREAARLLGWSINTLRDRLERFRIDEGEHTP